MANISVQITGGTKEDRRRLKQAAFFVLTSLFHEPEFAFLKKKAEISLGVALVENEEIKKINKRYRKKAETTDVLSFPFFQNAEELSSAAEGDTEIGDLVIAPDVVREEAARSRKKYYTQFLWVLTHGILHVLGLDHERSAREARRMRALEEKLAGSSES